MEPWVNAPMGPIAREIQPIYWIMFGFAVVVLVIVVGGLILAGFLFRERPGHEAKQFHGHNLLELAWTVIPTLMVIFFTVISFQRLQFINDSVTDTNMTVQVQGAQWSWSYQYPEDPMFLLDDGSYLQAGEELNIPVGAKVRLELSATDVIHDFWVPALGGKRDAVPGRATDLWIGADRPGTYKGQCAEFCGDGHADMLIVVVAHDPANYAAWAREAVARANRFNDPATAQGRELFLSLACANCHLIRGTSAAGRVGPELTNFATQDQIAGVVPLTQENLERWIANAPAVKPGTIMPPFLDLPAAQVTAIANFLLTLEGD